MSALTKILTGAAGLAAAVGFASPAAAQYYPNQGYGYGNNNVLGQVVNNVLGYGRYPYGNYGYGQTNDRYAVDQCARTVEARLNGGGYGNYGGYGNSGYGGYNQGYGGYGNQGYGYNQHYGGGRVQGITRVERKSYGLKVYGVASSGNRGYDGYNRRGYGNYGYNAGADLKFNCQIDRNGRLRDVDIKRRSSNGYYRGY